MEDQFAYQPWHTVLIVLVSVILYVYYGLTTSRIFAKAGVKAWQGWVPFLNSWRLLQLGGKHGAWLLINLVPIVGQLIYQIMYWIAQYRIGNALQKSGVFVLLAIIIQPLWFGILAWDRSTWSPEHETLIPGTAKS